ncbi:hypothetical protein CRC_02660 [Cylindrospermopsis raciborskii CS-505]|nr:hypothetical protein CRC_02660 [Cylindrospermopsis raciborskii CS-505]
MLVSINSTSQREAGMLDLTAIPSGRWVSINSTSQREAGNAELGISIPIYSFPLIPLPRGKRAKNRLFYRKGGLYSVSINSTSQREAGFL